MSELSRDIYLYTIDYKYHGIRGDEVIKIWKLLGIWMNGSGILGDGSCWKF